MDEQGVFRSQSGQVPLSLGEAGRYHRVLIANISAPESNFLGTVRAPSGDAGGQCSHVIADAT